MKLFDKLIEFFKELIEFVKELFKPLKIRYIYGYSYGDKAFMVTYGYSLEECRSNIEKGKYGYEPELGGDVGLLCECESTFPLYHYVLE